MQHPELPALPGSQQNLPASSFPSPGEGFQGQDDVTREAGGRLWGTFHVSWRSESHLCVHTAPAPRQDFLSPNTAQQPPLCCAAHNAAPQGIPSAGFRVGPCTASGCPTAGSPWLLLPSYRHRVSRHLLQGEKPGLGADLLGSCLPWVGAASGAEFAQILAQFYCLPPAPHLSSFLPLGADGWW